MHQDHLPDLLDADRRRLVRAAARLLGPADAEDAVQDAYVRALEAEDLALNAAQAWLLTVVRRLAIDHLRRRQWLARWQAEMAADDPLEPTSPSAEADAALAQAAAHALRRLAAHLDPADGAALLLHEVFEVEHAEIALAAGRSEATSRQRLRRALSRLRHQGGEEAEAATHHEHFFRAYLQSLRLRDPQILWGMLREPPIRATAQLRGQASYPVATSTAPATACGLLQVGGELGLVLTLDGVRLSVVPLGVRSDLGLDEPMPMPVPG